MRRVSDHIVLGNSASDVAVTVLDEPGQGGANHQYMLTWAEREDTSIPLDKTLAIGFQDGPIREVGQNGVTQEALLAVVIDRLRSFQNGPFRCRENAIALTHCEDALMWLQRRTRDRLQRAVEGTNQV